MAGKATWDYARLERIFEDSKSFFELWDKLAVLRRDMQKAKKIEKAATLEIFWRRASQYARLRGFVKPHHLLTSVYSEWNDEKRERFTRDAYTLVAEKRQLSWLIKQYPELRNEIAARHALNKITGGLNFIAEKLRQRARAGKAVEPHAHSLTPMEQKFFGVVRELLMKKRCVRVHDVHAAFRGDKDKVRGMMVRLSGASLIVNIPGEHHVYFSNERGFYKPEELLTLVPGSEQDRIAALVSRGPVTAARIAQQLYGKYVGGIFLATYLDDLVAHELLSFEDGEYMPTKMGTEFGFDAQSVKTIKTMQLENQLHVDSEEKVPEFNSLEEVSKALKKDRANLTVHPFDLNNEVRSKDEVRVLLGAEILFGNQDTASDLLLWALGQTKPDISLVSGLVQGTFSATHTKKARILAEQRKLHKIGPQISAAGLLLAKLEAVTKGSVCVVQGDDDFEIAENYANLAMLAEGHFWSFGVNTKSLSAELRRQLYIREQRMKQRIQWETIIPYWLRIGRSLKNVKEVYNAIGVMKSEYRLIIEILCARRNGFEYPKEYEKVVNVQALLGNVGRRVVTPDSLSLKFWDKEIRFVHSTQFSDVTQYVDPLMTLEKITRHLGARDIKMPWMTIDGHQEFFYGTYFQGHWVMTMPGMQDATLAAQYRKKVFASRVLTSKAHRQNTFRKSPTTPAMPEITILKDGRLRLRLLNDRMKEVIEAQRSKPEENNVVCFLTDTQFGSITMQPELVMKYVDYALYERGATRMRLNGDILQGVMYPAFFAENRPLRLTSTDSQQRFTKELLMPLVYTAPHLRDFYAWQGNHEWQIWDNSITGENALFFLEAHLNGFIEGQKRAGITPLLQHANTISRIMWKKTVNPGPDRILYPLFTEEIAGFKVAYTHMWQPYGGGRTPVDQPRKWLSNMADAAGDIDMLLGGHLHSVWMAQEYGKFLLHNAAAASQSGYELARGLMSTVMFTLLQFNNRTGITVEFVPWQFLEAYRCQSPALKGKDKLLELPPDDSREYAIGKYSPYIENLIDELTWYRPT